MLVFPNCKINLGLHICSKRADGFHNIETVFYPVAIKDALEILPSHDTHSEMLFTSSGLAVDGKEEDNICIKAYQLLKKDFPQLPAIKMHLHKAIPMGAGLGGGSADGAFALVLLNRLFKLGVSDEKLAAYALQLGSDCPFFILNKACYATGRGELLHGINLDLSAYTIAIINPGIHVNTGWAFSQLSPATPAQSITSIIAQPVTTWKDALQNDFEKPVFEKYPVIKSIKDQLYDMGAEYAAMSGSGSTVFGLFKTEVSLQSFADKNYFAKLII